MTAPRQLALPLPHLPSFTAADFLADSSNAAARTWLADDSEWPDRRLVLWGEEGTGKTHMLHIWCDRMRAVLLRGPRLRGWPSAPDGPVAVDDADLAGDEAALLHLMNAVREAGQSLLLASRTAPSAWPSRLPDLASRVRATTAVEVGRPDDAMLAVLFARLLVDRQLAVSEPVQDWLRARLPRSAAAMREAAARLDHATLAAGGRATRAIAALVVDSMTGRNEISGSVSPPPIKVT